ncbi:hypothetical protein J6590_085630 [Homalodisca vitripennis]|nr:hypothetical protein J6590_085630 [Homalodisca vitripennis]
MPGLGSNQKLRNFSLPKRIILLCGATRYSEYVVAYVTLEKRKASSDFASLVYAVIFCKRLVNPYTRSQHFPLVDVHRFAQISVPIGFAVPSMGYLEDINNPELNPLEAAYFLQRYLFERIFILTRTPFQARAPRFQASETN